MESLKGLHVHITGIVQGVGFRPFVYNLAVHMGLCGWVRNTSAGVDIEVDGSEQALDDFLRALQEQAPPLARILDLEASPRPANGFTSFEIFHSASIPGAFIPISPDVSICPDCLRELFDPADRRYRYPFINCTNCGPRFTIIEDIPYDRPKTTMKGFSLCPDCAAEYHNPADRRFHAQPVACPVCGPQVTLERWKDGAHEQLGAGDEAIIEAQKLLASGGILAVKGLGGFHLACDATRPEAVAELRRRKLRVDKPFALMMPDLETVETHCTLNPAERELLFSRQRPIVILKRKPGSNIAAQVAPNQQTIGVMLPYTPLHYLLFADALHPSAFILHPLVMTSGNLSEEPIATDNDEARQRLAPLADACLMHDRPIRTRCDDSVLCVVETSRAEVSAQDEHSRKIKPATYNVQPSTHFLRRSRGYAPDPVLFPFDAPPLLATGAELKNTFCHARQRLAFLSHHIGDLENYETLQSFEDGVAHFERLFRIQPSILAHDLHPNYLATRYALERASREGLETVGVQHHHAHIAACMAENGLMGDHPVIGVAFDGTGYGSDGAIWGGEFLLADYAGFERAAHLAYLLLPGGDAATRNPWRIALAYLWQAGIDWQNGLPPVEAACAGDRQALRSMLEHQINTPPTSSMGRLFDAAASLAGVQQTVNYEAQAAIEFEALADPAENGAYPFDIETQPQNEPRNTQYAIRNTFLILPAPALTALTQDWRAGAAPGVIAARFHNGVAKMVQRVTLAIREHTGINEVALSGGVWQNITLLKKSLALLSNSGFTVYTHRQVPANDGGLALGQAAIATARQIHLSEMQEGTG